MFAVIAAMAEFERKLIRERIHAGLRRARAGEALGAPTGVYQPDQILPLHQAGYSIRRIAHELGISRRAVQRALKGAQNPLPDLATKGAISQGLLSS